MNIREATSDDRDGIQQVYLCAFPESESSLIAKLAVDLLLEKTTPHSVSLVAEAGGKIVGHVAFSPVVVDNAEDFLGYVLAPLAVKPDHQKGGIGSKLIEVGMQGLSDKGTDVIFVYGDPNYYGRFGFSADAANQYATPYKLQYPSGWQAIVLNEYQFDTSSVAITCVDALRDPHLW